MWELRVLRTKSDSNPSPLSSSAVHFKKNALPPKSAAKEPTQYAIALMRSIIQFKEAYDGMSIKNIGVHFSLLKATVQNKEKSSSLFLTVYFISLAGALFLLWKWNFWHSSDVPEAIVFLQRETLFARRQRN